MSKKRFLSILLYYWYHREIPILIISAKFTLKLQWANVKWDLFKEVGFLLFQRKCKTKSFTVYKHTWAKITHGKKNSECIISTKVLFAYVMQFNS